METTERAVRQRDDLGPLHALLLRIAPVGFTDALEERTPSVPTLARALGLSNWALYMWIKNNRIPANRVKRLVEIADGRVTAEEIHPFVFV